MIEPTEDELRNNWTAESLTRYIEDCEKRQLKVVSEGRKPKPPTVQNSKYNLYKIWR